MTNLSKTFDDSFKKEVIELIKQGLKKELPTGAVYSASKKPPEGAREFTTDRGTKYWIPGKKDKEDKQAKPKASSTPKTVNISQEKAQDLYDTFRSNNTTYGESDAFYSVNSKLLADNFGTPAQQKRMNEIVSRHKMVGDHINRFAPVSDKDTKWMTENILPLKRRLIDTADGESS